ncbi:prepilin peptidase [Anaerosoma tenue]|uniref:prepilin peptidase n=1 Tax=Anaerosoma tenue TaxID=2933588 RepID=UPI002260C9BF|nr:A24 family peptidase [Anaerosoma tenue]MCK8114415.1 prepilin peptidase [Anaerosoma tenue]
MAFDIPGWYFTLSMGLFGLLFGSFANVVIWRVPRGESIAHPGSHCPGCDTPIAWYDNIPVVSWLVLRGRCRHCHKPIAPRYPLVEAVSGALFVAAALVWGPGARALFGAALFWFLLALSLIDLEHMRLPNPLVATLAAVGLLGALLSELGGAHVVPLTADGASGVAAHPLALSLIGVLLGAGLPAMIAFVYSAIRGRSGFGMGDVKLLGALGLFLGPYVLVTFFVASLLGAVGGAVIARGRDLSQRRVPFGPWLAAGAAITAVLGPALVSGYLSLVGIA